MFVRVCHGGMISLGRGRVGVSLSGGDVVGRGNWVQVAGSVSWEGIWSDRVEFDSRNVSRAGGECLGRRLKEKLLGAGRII